MPAIRALTIKTIVLGSSRTLSISGKASESVKPRLEKLASMTSDVLIDQQRLIAALRK